MAITQKQARMELDRRATNGRARYVYDTGLASKADGPTLRDKAGKYTPKARPENYGPTPDPTVAPLGSKANEGQTGTEADAKTAFDTGFAKAKVRKQWSGKRAYGNVLYKGMSIKDAVAEAVAHTAAYVPKAERTNA